MGRAIFIGLVLCVLFSECTKDHTTSSTCTNCPVTVSFDTVIIPIFAQYCATSGCHNATSHQGGAILDSADAYAYATQSGTGYVIQGKPLQSILYNNFGQNIMPPTGYTKPTPCEIQEIYCWILQGAMNN